MDTLVVDVLDRRDHLLSRQRIVLDQATRRFTIGRSAGCEVVLDDPYVAPVHVTLDVTPDGRVLLTDAGSVNGVWLDGRRLRGAKSVELSGNALRIGHTRILLRSGNERLAPEKADRSGPMPIEHRPVKWVALGLALTVAQLIYTSWIAAPRDLVAVVATQLLGWAMLAGGWIGIWALLSRIMLIEWRWLTHSAIFLCSAGALLFADAMFDIGLFAFDLGDSRTVKAALGTLAAGALLYFHLVYASPLRRRVAALCAFLLPVLAVGTTGWVQARHATRNVNLVEPAPATFPPYLRLRAAKPLDSFFAAAGELRAEADRKRVLAIAEGEAEEEFGDE